MIHIKEKVKINKPIEDVWAVLYGDFANIGNWATGIYHSRPGTTDENLDRVCTTFTGKLYEKFNSVDEENYTFDVDVEGLPFFVESAHGGWTLNKIDDGSTDGTVEFQVTTKGIIGKIMQVPMKSKLTSGFRETLEDVVAYIETGKVSDKKQAELAKKKSS